MEITNGTVSGKEQVLDSKLNGRTQTLNYTTFNLKTSLHWLLFNLLRTSVGNTHRNLLRGCFN